MPSTFLRFFNSLRFYDIFGFWKKCHIFCKFAKFVYSQQICCPIHPHLGMRVCSLMLRRTVLKIFVFWKFLRSSLKKKSLNSQFFLPSQRAFTIFLPNGKYRIENVNKDRNPESRAAPQPEGMVGRSPSPLTGHIRLVRLAQLKSENRPMSLIFSRTFYWMTCTCSISLQHTMTREYLTFY